MAKKNDAETGTPTQSSPTALSDPQAIKKTSMRASCRYNNVIFPLIAVIALLLAGFASYQSWQLHNLQLQQKIDTLQAQQSATGSQFSAIDKSLQDAELKLQTRVNDLNKNLQTALKQRLYQKQDWLLLQARYYLELAQINAHWSKDQKTTTALLQEADGVLQGMSMQELLPVRQAIATEISQIKARPVVDITGLLSQLDAAQSLISDLPIKQSVSDPEATHQKAKTTSSSTWRNTLNDSVDLLQKLVVIRHHDGDIQPILSPMHQALLRENVRMNLQQAQWAVLQNNAAVFDYSLTNAIKEIEKTFEKSAKNTQSLIEQLQALQQIKLNVPVPALNRSLKLLNELIDSNNSSGVLPASTTGDEAP
ncbi:MAG: uroporphyrinogen-III C-methyltransferase [Legionella sp.]|nr:uroporphyrinogen-III C-methyltransferase [Legionella sp.]